MFISFKFYFFIHFFPLLSSAFSLQTQYVEINSLLISYRVVLEVAGNSDAVILTGLEADTQYQVTVAALWGGHKYRSRPIVFRTLGKSNMTEKISIYTENTFKTVRLVVSHVVDLNEVVILSGL